MAGSQQDERELRELFESTYHSLRVAILALGLLLPPALWVGGLRRDGIHLQDSMSAYYYTGMRDVFVGSLWAVGVALIAYKGFSNVENRVLSVGGVLAVGVALFPTTAPGEPSSAVAVVHTVAALSFFACLAYVAIARAADTLLLVRDARLANTLRRWYRILGAAMLASPLLALILAVAVRPPEGSLRAIFFLEAVGVWVFAAYWSVKSWELRRTSADRALMRGILLPVEPSSVPGRLRQIAPLDEDELGTDLVRRGARSGSPELA
jgi:hypothetical protein